MRALVILAMAAVAALAQDLPPGVLLLSKIKRHVRQQLEHLPDFTCLETAQRSTRGGRPGSKLEREDTVRVEVLFTGNQELYSPPGEAAFSDHPITEYISSGMIGDGLFATDMHNIFGGEVAIISYRGEEQWNGTTAARYDFRLPELVSRFTLSVPAGSGTVGTRGSFWADPKTYDVLRIETHADEIPPALGVRGMASAVDYARTRIGENDVTLAQDAQVDLLLESGQEGHARYDFTHCRAFHAESTIHFGEAPERIFGNSLRPAVQGAPRQALPGGVTITIALTAPLDEKTRAGDLIEARVAGDVQHKRKLLIADGTLLRGRVREVERSPDGESFHMALEFTELEMPDGAMRFFADLQSPQPALPSDGTWVHDIPGVAAFTVRGTRLQLPQGFRMVWRTRELAESTNGHSGRGNRRP